MKQLSVYFDAVLNDRMYPIFNGTPEQTKDWLLENKNHPEATQVCIGLNMSVVSIDRYLNNFR